MGRYVAKINNTYTEYGDYAWDYVKQNQSKEYYEKERIEVEVAGNNVNVPVLELVDIKKNIKTYSWVWSDDKSLHSWLFKYLREKGEKIQGVISVSIHTGLLNYDKPANDGYFLQSDIGDENVILAPNEKLYEIENYSDYEWLRLRYLIVM